MPPKIASLPGADLTKYPTPDSSNPLDPKTSITMGDLHGNALKFIWTLIRQNALELKPVPPSLKTPEDVYSRLVAIYNTPAEQLNKDDIRDFNTIIQAATLNKLAGVRIIGDELADRGNNDYFTIKLFEKLGKEGTPVDVLLSNHSAEFLDVHNNDTLRAPKTDFLKDYLNPHDRKSLQGLSTLIERGLVDAAEIKTIVEQYYKPNLKAISYSVDTSNKPPVVTLYTHAPVGLETVKATAEYYKIPYDDSSVDALCRTIDVINSHFYKEICSKKSIHASHATLPKEVGLGSSAIPTTCPLLRLMWNRGGSDLFQQLQGNPDYGITLPKTQHNYSLRAVHGHDGPSFRIFPEPGNPDVNLSPYDGTPTQSYLPNMMNTDNDLGKRELTGDFHVILQDDEIAFSPNLSPSPVLMPMRVEAIFRNLQQTMQTEAVKQMPTTDLEWHGLFTDDKLQGIMSQAERNLVVAHPEQLKSYQSAVKGLIFFEAGLSNKTPRSDKSQTPVEAYEEKFKGTSSSVATEPAQASQNSLIAFSMAAASESQSYRSKLEAFKERTMQKEKLSAMESTTGNASAQKALSSIRRLIEDTHWELGKWGSKSTISVNGVNKAIPGHALKIYERCLKGERGTDAVKCLEDIRKISADAAKPQSLVLFKRFRERYQSTTDPTFRTNVEDFCN